MSISKILFFELNGFNVTLLIDVIEHVEKNEGKRMLKNCKVCPNF
jgi:hypothetical protein